MKELLGKKILKILINKESDVLVFKTDLWDVNYVAEWDCCSSSWVSNIEADVATPFKDIFWLEVKEVVEMDLSEQNIEDDPKYDYLQVYWYELKFEWDKSLFITYRNSSNWYYGGWLWYTETIKKYMELKNITEKYISELV
jgi:hypothetical protein